MNLLGGDCALGHQRLYGLHRGLYSVHIVFRTLTMHSLTVFRLTHIIRFVGRA